MKFGEDLRFLYVNEVMWKLVHKTQPDQSENRKKRIRYTKRMRERESLSKQKREKLYFKNTQDSIQTIFSQSTLYTSPDNGLTQV